MNRKMLVRLLERFGHSCVEADDGKRAIEVFRADQDAARQDADHLPLTCVLMDFEMPKLNGPDATAKLRELGCTAWM